jgi:hypothetical protein
MWRPSNRYLYGRSATFGTNVNVTRDADAAVNAEMAAERTAHATTQALAKKRAVFHALLADPSTSERLTAMLADNARIDAQLGLGDVVPCVDVVIVPVSIDTAGVVDVVLERMPSGETLEAADARLRAEIRADQLEDLRDGDACSPSCGYCGRCSSGPRPTATCGDCRADFVKGYHDVGSLCNACSDQRDAHTDALELRQMVKAVLRADWTRVKDVA